jgi:DNA-binding NarL/FixJ family response regulator
MVDLTKIAFEFFFFAKKDNSPLTTTIYLSMTIKIAIADDHKTFRQALVHYLSTFPTISVLFEANNGEELLQNLKKQEPEIIILDLKMPQLDGLETLKILTVQYPHIRVLILSAFFDETYVAQCLQYGINGYLTKYSDLDELYKAINLAYRNEVYSTNIINNALLKKYIHAYNKQQAPVLPDFSEADIKILQLLKEERTTDEISTLMNLSKRSIELKRDKMREKSNTKTVAGLLLYAIKRGFIE